MTVPGARPPVSRRADRRACSEQSRRRGIGFGLSGPGPAAAPGEGASRDIVRKMPVWLRSGVR